MWCCSARLQSESTTSREHATFFFPAGERLHRGKIFPCLSSYWANRPSSRSEVLTAEHLVSDLLPWAKLPSTLDPLQIPVLRPSWATPSRWSCSISVRPSAVDRLNLLTNPRTLQFLITGDRPPSRPAGEITLAASAWMVLANVAFLGRGHGLPHIIRQGRAGKADPSPAPL